MPGSSRVPRQARARSGFSKCAPAAAAGSLVFCGNVSSGETIQTTPTLGLDHVQTQRTLSCMSQGCILKRHILIKGRLVHSICSENSNLLFFPCIDGSVNISHPPSLKRHAHHALNIHIVHMLSAVTGIQYIKTNFMNYYTQQLLQAQS